MHALTSRKVSHKDTQIHNKFSQFTKPIGETGDLVVGGNLSVSGKTTVQKLDVLQDLHIYANVSSNGTMIPAQYIAGQVVNVCMLSNTDINQTTQTVADNSTNTIFTYSYTPIIANSYIIVEYQTINFSSGSAGDEIYAYLYSHDANDNRIGTTYQRWIAANGGGTRSGTLFPIVGRYTNTNKNAKIIRVDINNNSNDILTVNGDNSTWLKITEIGR